MSDLPEETSDETSGEIRDAADKTDQSESRLNEYLTELVNSQDDRLLKESDITALRQKYPLTPGDEDKLSMLIERHLSRALDYKGSERWDSAIVETERALLFTPLNNEIRLDLAELYLKRSVQYGYLRKDLQRAEREVDDALMLEPANRAARKFQKELKDLGKMLRGTRHNKRLALLILLVIVILGAALYPRLRNRFSFLSLEEEPEIQGDIELFAPPWETRELEYSETTSLKEEFSMDLKEATLIRESISGTPALSIAGYMEPLKDDFSSLEIELFRGDTNDSLGRIQIVDAEDAPLRMGETRSFQNFIYLNDNLDDLKSLYIGISGNEKFRPAEPGEWFPMTLHDGGLIPRDVFIDTEGSFESQIEGYDRNYLFYEVRVNNKSTVPLSTLNMDVQWRDDTGNLVAVKPLTLADHEALPVKAKSVQSSRIMFDLDKKYINGSIAVVVKDVKKQ